MENKSKYREDADKWEGKVGGVLLFQASRERTGEEQTLERPLYVILLNSHRTMFSLFPFYRWKLRLRGVRSLCEGNAAAGGLKKKSQTAPSHHSTLSRTASGELKRTAGRLKNQVFLETDNCDGCTTTWMYLMPITVYLKNGKFYGCIFYHNQKKKKEQESSSQTPSHWH